MMGQRRRPATPKTRKGARARGRTNLSEDTCSTLEIYNLHDEEDKEGDKRQQPTDRDDSIEGRAVFI